MAMSISDETMQALDDMYSLLGDISTISGNMEKVAKINQGGRHKWTG